MEDKKKYKIILQCGLYLSAIIFAILFIATKTCVDQQKQIITFILYFYYILFICVIVIYILAMFNKTLNIWASALTTAFIIYSGVQLFSLSQYRDLLKDLITWDPSMLGLGIAVVAFGWSFATQYSQQQNTKKDQDHIEALLTSINKNVKKTRIIRIIKK
jgi:hypothetical protein